MRDAPARATGPSTCWKRLGLGLFMIAAVGAATLLEHPASPLAAPLADPLAAPRADGPGDGRDVDRPDLLADRRAVRRRTSTRRRPLTFYRLGRVARRRCSPPTSLAQVARRDRPGSPSRRGCLRAVDRGPRACATSRRLPGPWGEAPALRRRGRHDLRADVGRAARLEPSALVALHRLAAGVARRALHHRRGAGLRHEPQPGPLPRPRARSPASSIASGSTSPAPPIGMLLAAEAVRPPARADAGLLRQAPSPHRRPLHLPLPLRRAESQ